MAGGFFSPSARKKRIIIRKGDVTRVHGIAAHTIGRRARSDADKESAEVRLPLSLRVTASVRTPGEAPHNYNNQPLIALILDVYLRRTLHVQCGRHAKPSDLMIDDATEVGHSARRVEFCRFACFVVSFDG